MATRRLQLVLDLDTGGYSGKLTRAGSQMKSFSGNVEKANRSMHQMGGRFDSLNRTMRAPLDKLRDYVLILSNIRLAFLNVRDLTVGWIGAMVKQSAEVERLTILMKGLSDETDEFNKSLDSSITLQRLFALARENGMGVREITDAFVKMKSGGVDPMNGSLNSLTDAVAKFGGTSETMHRASIAIQQMAGKGVVSMEELRQQLGEAVPTAMRDMARAARMSVKEFTDLVSKGKVQAEPALELMFREFTMLYGGAGERIAKTVTGQMAALKTNAMELSTFFTGQAQQNNVAWMKYVEEQKALLKDGKISGAQFEINTANGGDTLYSGLAAGMKELNEALQSPEARTTMMKLGEIVSEVGQMLLSALRTVVEWKDEIIVVSRFIGGAFAFWVSLKVGKWILDVAKSFRQMALGAVGNLTTLNGKMGQFHDKLITASNGYDRLNATQKKSLESIQRHGAAATKAVHDTRNQIAALRDKRIAYTQNIGILEKQIVTEQRQLATAHTLYKAEVSQGRVRATTANNLKVAKENLRKSEMALDANRKRLSATNQQLTLSERRLTAAIQQQQVATARAQKATAGLTGKQKILNGAAKAGSVAIRGMGMAMNAALGPIGMIAFALYQAADAAGFFESAADRATAATARLMSGIASLEAMKDAQQAKADLVAQKEKLEADKAAAEKGYRYEGRNRIVVSKDTSKIDADIAAIEKKIETTNRALEVGQIAIDAETGRNQANMLQAGREALVGKENRRYQTMLAGGASDEELAAQADLIEKLAARYDGATIEKLQDGLAAAFDGGDQNQARRIQAMIEQYKTMNGITDEQKLSSEELRDALLGVGKATGGASAAQKKAARDFDKYNDMIARNAGNIAEMTAQLEGGEGALAEFEARLANGLFDGITEGQIETMRKQFAEIERLNKELDFKASFGQLQKELASANAEASRLWNSLANGTWDEDLRRSQVEGRFEEQLSAAAGDPEKMAKVRAEIDATVEAINQIDAANIARDWELATEDILIGLMTEEEARQANFDKEVERQRQLIALAGQDIEKRQRMQQTFDAWYAARQRQLVRENESGVITMSRDWARLGQNMDTVVTGAMDSMINTMAEGKFAFGDIIADVMKQIMKVILRAMIAYAILSAIGATNGASFGTFMKGQLGGFGDGFASQRSNGNHAIGSLSQGSIANTNVQLPTVDVPKVFHTGGWFGSGPLKAGEVPLVGQEDEVALTRDQQRFYGKAFEAATAGVAPEIEINMINNSGTPVSAEQGSSRMDGRKMIVDVVVDALNKEGPLRTSVEQLQRK